MVDLEFYRKHLLAQIKCTDNMQAEQDEERNKAIAATLLAVATGCTGLTYLQSKGRYVFHNDTITLAIEDPCDVKQQQHVIEVLANAN